MKNAVKNFQRLIKGTDPLFPQLSERELTQPATDQLVVVFPSHLDGISWAGRFGKNSLPHRAATSHFAYIGATGSGKTISIRMLMQTVLPFVSCYENATFDHRAMVYDPKGDMRPVLEGISQWLRDGDQDLARLNVVTLNPFDKDGAAWDIARDITERAHALEISSILIPAEKNSQQPFFGDAARHLLEGVITAFMLSAGGRWTFRDVVYAMGSASRIIEVLNLHEETRELIPLYFNHKETAKNIMSTIATKMRPYRAIAALWDKAAIKISLTDWFQSPSERYKIATGNKVGEGASIPNKFRNYILLLGNDETAREAIDRINQVIFKRVSQMILRQDDLHPQRDFLKLNSLPYDGGVDRRRHWIVLDEVRHAGRLDGLNTLLQKGRSKGAAVVLGFQDIDGLRAVYGKEEADELVGQCSSYSVFRLQSPETAEWASRLFASSELLEEYKDVSRNESYSSSYTSGNSSSSSTYGSSAGRGLSRRLSYRESKNLLAAQFIYIKPVNKENGLFGWYMSTHIKYPYGIDIPGDLLFGSETEKGWLAEIPSWEMKPRDAEDQKLRPWTGEERKDLGLRNDIYEHQTHREKRFQEIQRLKAKAEEIEAIAGEFAELAFYQGGALTAEEQRELQDAGPNAEAIYTRILAKLRNEAGENKDEVDEVLKGLGLLNNR